MRRVAESPTREVSECEVRSSTQVRQDHHEGRWREADGPSYAQVPLRPPRLVCQARPGIVTNSPPGILANGSALALLSRDDEVRGLGARDGVLDAGEGVGGGGASG
jgi:hypothetical protein